MLDNASVGNDLHIIKLALRGEEVREYTLDTFRDATGVTYLPGLEYKDERTLQRIRRQCADALEMGYVDTESRWLGSLHAEEVRNHSVADVSIRWIDETLRYGLFAERRLAAGDYIGEYTGVVRRIGLLSRDINDYCYAYPTSAKYRRKHVIDAQQKGNEMRYINHGDSPNGESIGALCDGLLHVIVRAARDISAGTQVTCDYSDFFWSRRVRVPNLPAE
jgi:hypothetical protein